MAKKKIEKMDGSVRVILDTNFLMIPAQFKIDIFEELRKLISSPYDLCVFQASIDELGKIASGKGRDSSAARIALMLIKQKNLKTLENSYSKNSSYADEIIVNSVLDSDLVCSQDIALKRLLKHKSKKIRIITLKARKHLGFI